MNINEKDTTIALMGAGGKMGTRILNNLVKTDFNLLLCETAPQGIKAIEERGYTVTGMEKAIPEGDFIIMAVPDAVLGKISHDVVPRMKANA
ncbi:MAG: NAD(P)-binding domain-containing protein, partial [Spirochaetes bacterium]|nr:NAD(P)-binding domain-containing protein [Spirochaetota bacterium]